LLFMFLRTGSMQMMKMAQLKASPCLTPLSIFIGSVVKPFIRILAVMLLYSVLNVLMKFVPKPYSSSVSEDVSQKLKIVLTAFVNNLLFSSLPFLSNLKVGRKYESFTLSFEEN
jgi:hypothetical protein